MNIIITILLVLAAIIGLLLIFGIFMRRSHFVKREIVINAPRQKVFDFIKLLRNQDAFNKHAMVEPERNRNYKGIDGTVGYIYSWGGKNADSYKSAGEGEKEIIDILEGKKIEMEIRLVKPMRATASIVMETESLSEAQTKVYWSNSGNLNYPVNIFIPLMEKSVAKDMDSSLVTLKSILEK